MKEKLTEEQEELLKQLQKEIVNAAKKVVDDYVDNPSENSGSSVNIHQNSPFLDTEKDSDVPLYSGSRWTKVLKNI